MTIIGAEDYRRKYQQNEVNIVQQNNEDSSKNIETLSQQQILCRNQHNFPLTDCCICLLCYSWLFLSIWSFTWEYQSSDTIQETRWVLAHLPDRNNTSPWSLTLNQSNKLSVLGNQVVPVIFKMSNFTKKMKNKEEWKSSSFYALHGGYQLYLKVNAAGHGDGEGSHVSVYLYHMKGPYDDELMQSGHWPLTGIFTIELLNQQNDTNHFTQKLSVTDEPEDTTSKEIKDDIVWEVSQFISHDIILNYKRYNYLKNDCLFFRINFKHKRYPFHFNFHLMDHLAWSLLGGVLVALVFNRSYRNLSVATHHGYANLLMEVIIGSVVVGSFLGGIVWLLSIFPMALLIRELLMHVLRKLFGQYAAYYIAYSFEAEMLLYILCSFLIRTILLDILYMPWGILWYLM